MAKKANVDIGLAGEYYVASVMHLKGWTACLTLKNYPFIDILGYDPLTKKRSEIQVKTGMNKYTVLTGLDTKNFHAKINCIQQIYVFVHIINDSFECYILKSNDFINLATQTVNQMNTVSNGKTAPIKFKWKQLQQYKNKWNNLW